MHLTPLLLSLSLSLSLIPTSATTLNITVINAVNNHSTLECWALEPGFQTSSQAGTAGTLALNMGFISGPGVNATFTVLPPGFEGGRHNAPVRQWVLFLTGHAHITLPNSPLSAQLTGGKYGTILALDTADVSASGHVTTYPSDGETVAVQIPLGEEEGVPLPGHVVLYEGGCWGVEVGEG